MTFPHLVLASEPHDRSGEHRADDSWLEQAWDDPSTRVLVVAGSRVRPLDGKVPWVAPTDEPEPSWLLERLADRGVRSLLIEGGATINAAFLADGAVDEL